MDTRTGQARAAGEIDKIRGFRRVSGGSGNDTLFGSDAGEALYGGDGNDRVDGRGGADLIVDTSFDAALSSPASVNRLLGGPGDDLIDARTRAVGSDGPPPLGSSTVTCGEGADRVAGETDDFLDSSCEAAVYRVQLYESQQEGDVGAFFALVMPIAPVARGADGAPTFEVPCPAKVSDISVARCVGNVVLERPPTAGSTGAEQLGSGSFNLQGGGRASVAVALNDAGRQALATPGKLLAVRVAAQLTGARTGAPPLRADFGWLEVF